MSNSFSFNTAATNTAAIPYTTGTVNYPYYYYYPSPCQCEKATEVLERIILRLEKRIEESRKS